MTKAMITSGGDHLDSSEGSGDIIECFPFNCSPSWWPFFSPSFCHFGFINSWVKLVICWKLHVTEAFSAQASKEMCCLLFSKLVRMMNLDFSGNRAKWYCKKVLPRLKCFFNDQRVIKLFLYSSCVVFIGNLPICALKFHIFESMDEMRIACFLNYELRHLYGNFE